LPHRNNYPYAFSIIDLKLATLCYRYLGPPSNISYLILNGTHSSSLSSDGTYNVTSTLLYPARAEYHQWRLSCVVNSPLLESNGFPPREAYQTLDIWCMYFIFYCLHAHTHTRTRTRTRTHGHTHEHTHTHTHTHTRTYTHVRAHTHTHTRTHTHTHMHTHTHTHTCTHTRTHTHAHTHARTHTHTHTHTCTHTHAIYTLYMHYFLTFPRLFLIGWRNYMYSIIYTLYMHYTIYSLYIHYNIYTIYAL